MALSKYVSRVPPRINLPLFVSQELRQIELSTNAIVELLLALEVPIEIGPADSAGAGFRVLRIPN
jgi:hypothetical protein